MNRRMQRIEGKGAIELLEEAVHLLRLIPSPVLLSYYTGSFPFVLGFLYFWADMSRSAFADRHAAAAAFFLSLLFIWMKCWHAVFSQQLRAHLKGDPLPRWPLRRIFRLIGTQTVLQPWGFLLLPLAFLVMIPFGSAYAFYQNVTVFGEGEAYDLRSVYRRSQRQATLFPAQNHLILLILSLFALVVFLNLAVALYLSPHLVQTLFGVETELTRAGWYFLNTTFLAVVCGLAYLMLDPIVKSVYTLRYFYGESLTTGEDLIAYLKDAERRLRSEAAALLLLVVWASAGVGTARAEEPAVQSPRMSGAAPPSAEALSAPEIDRAVEETMGRREYAWRMPRVKESRHEPKGFVASFIDGAIDTIGGWIAPVKRWIKKGVDWILESLFSRFRIDPGDERREFGWFRSIANFLYALLSMIAFILAVTLWKVWGRRKSILTESTKMAEAFSQKVDLSAENVTADLLSADQWLVLGRQWMEKGDLRLALRAFYLASLSHLAEQGGFTIAAFKSNREYIQELRREAHSAPDLISAFSQNVTLFERIWYGLEEITTDMVGRFEANQERIMAHAQRR